MRATRAGTIRYLMARTLTDRITSNTVVSEDGCWIWQRHIAENGYGQISIGSRTDGTRRNTLAHRVAYEAFKKSIPQGLQIDHLCKVRSCVNPEHLETVTPRENVHRSDARWRQQLRRTHCPQGHEYIEGNLYRYLTRAGNLNRNCKKCMIDRSRSRWLEKKSLTEVAHA